MNISKLLLVGAVALTGVILTPSAKADDHHRDHRDHHRDYRHDDRRYYESRPVYYTEARPSYYYNDGPYYYGDRGVSSVTIAVGGHRSHHHRR